MTKSECLTDPEFFQIIAGDLDDQTAARIAAHLENCEACSSRLAELELLSENEELWGLIDWTSLEDGETQHREQRVSMLTDQILDRIDEPTVQPEKTARTPPELIPANHGRIGKLQITECIGRGGMGSVFRAWHLTIRQWRAVKFLAPTTGMTADTASRFLSEAQKLAKLASRHFVHVYDIEIDHHQPYLEMDLLDGCDLGKLLKRSRAISLADSCRIMSDVAEGLAILHGEGLIHRDIKPANIFLTSDGTVRILDLGLAQSVRHDEHTGNLYQSANYSSPEQKLGTKLDLRSDLYSFGITLRELLSKRPAADEHNLEKGLPSSPPALDELLNRLCAHDREVRPNSASTVAAELATFADGADLEYLSRHLSSRPEEVVPDPRAIPPWLALVCLIAVSVVSFAAGHSNGAFDQNTATGPVTEGTSDQEPALIWRRPTNGSASGYATLNEALASAQSGDVVALSGEGPFALNPIQLNGRSLVLAASPGVRPTVQCLMPKSTSVAFEVDGALHLRGINLMAKTTSEQQTLLDVRGGTVSINNCDVRVSGPGSVSEVGPDCRVDMHRTAVFLSPAGRVLRCRDQQEPGKALAEFACDECLLVNGTIFDLDARRNSGAILNAGLDRVTALSQSLMRFTVSADDTDDNTAEPLCANIMSLKVTASIVHCNEAVVTQPEQGIEPSRRLHVDELKRIVDWEPHQTRLSVADHWISGFEGSQEQIPQSEEEWQDLWTLNTADFQAVTLIGGRDSELYNDAVASVLRDFAYRDDRWLTIIGGGAVVAARCGIIAGQEVAVSGDASEITSKIEEGGAIPVDEPLLIFRTIVSARSGNDAYLAMETLRDNGVSRLLVILPRVDFWADDYYHLIQAAEACGITIDVTSTTRGPSSASQGSNSQNIETPYVERSLRADTMPHTSSPPQFRSDGLSQLLERAPEAAITHDFAPVGESSYSSSGRGPVPGCPIRGVGVPRD